MDRVTKYSILTAIPAMALLVVIWFLAPSESTLGVVLLAAIGLGSGRAIRRFWTWRLGEPKSQSPTDE